MRIPLTKFSFIMKESWNNCPICNKEMAFSDDGDIIGCPNNIDSHYFIGLDYNNQIDHECFDIEKLYLIYRLKNKTEICRLPYVNSNSYDKLVTLPFVLPYNKFDSISKIENLLLMS